MFVLSFKAWEEFADQINCSFADWIFERGASRDDLLSWRSQNMFNTLLILPRTLVYCVKVPDVII